MSAPFLPPKIAPMPAPAAVDPPITIAVFFQSRSGARSTRVVVRGAGDVVTTRRGAGAGAGATYGSYPACTGRTLLVGYAIGVRAYGEYGSVTSIPEGRSPAYIGRASSYA